MGGVIVATNRTGADFGVGHSTTTNTTVVFFIASSARFLSSSSMAVATRLAWRDPRHVECFESSRRNVAASVSVGIRPIPYLGDRLCCEATKRMGFMTLGGFLLFGLLDSSAKVLPLDARRRFVLLVCVYCVIQSLHVTV